MAKLAPSVVAVSIFILVFLAGYWGLLVPRLEELARLQADQAALQKQVAAQTPSAASQSGGQGISGLAQTKQEAERLLPSTDNQFDLAIQIEALAKASGIALSSMTFSNGSQSTLPPTSAAASAAASAAGSAGKLTVTLGVAGSYAAIQGFLSGLSQLDRFIQVDQLSLTAGTGGQLAAQLTAFAYYLPPVPSSKK